MKMAKYEQRIGETRRFLAGFLGGRHFKMKKNEPRICSDL